MSKLLRIVPLLGAALLAAAAGGCTVARAVATLDPGTVPRDGELVGVSGVGAEQVRFLFRFKVGPDGVAADSATLEAPAAPEPAAPVARIGDTRLTDTTGRSFAVVDREVRRAQNVYLVTLTSAAVSPETYELICQARLLVGAYQVKLAAGAFRELDGWRPDPRSFKFSVFAASGRSRWWLRERQFD